MATEATDKTGMASFHFMPWLRLQEPYSVGESRLIPWHTDNPPQEFNSYEREKVHSILSSYKSPNREPVRHFTVARFADHQLFADLNQAQREYLWDSVCLACLSGLAAREYLINDDPYCNADCFLIHGQRFPERVGHLLGTSLFTVRCGQLVLSYQSLKDVSFFEPRHVSQVAAVTLDGALLAGLARFRDTKLKGQGGSWARWRDAIVCFNRANTDSTDYVLWQADWVLLCSAFQRLLDAGRRSEAVAEKFTACFVPANYPLPIDTGLLREWQGDFQTLRGKFYAHGVLKSPATSDYGVRHLPLAIVAFPLLVRVLLNKEGAYRLSDGDLCAIAAFGELLKIAKDPPHDGSVLSWRGLVANQRLSLASARAAEELAGSQRPKD
ncbi:MAG TPA: hypothetical protein VEC38_07540 [Candidatus Binataceae bacterium]|nr:hypothetical protein [Candidatus Binataceae bacterium]